MHSLAFHWYISPVSTRRFLFIDQTVGSNNLGVDERRTDGGSPGKNVQKPNQRGKPAVVRANQKTVTWADRVRGVNLVKRDNNP